MPLNHGASGKAMGKGEEDAAKSIFAVLGNMPEDLRGGLQDYLDKEAPVLGEGLRKSLEKPKAEEPAAKQFNHADLHDATDAVVNAEQLWKKK